MQDRPDAAELLDAVAAYLFGELRPLVPRDERFRVLVAANVCAVVAREVRAGGEADQADLELFERLLGEEDSAAGVDREASGSPREAAQRLAERLRAGALDDSLDRILADLEAHVRRKLEIARPDYAAADGE